MADISEYSRTVSVPIGEMLYSMPNTEVNVYNANRWSIVGEPTITPGVINSTRITGSNIYSSSISADKVYRQPFCTIDELKEEIEALKDEIGGIREENEEIIALLKTLIGGK